jgi:hypothetical protein
LDLLFLAITALALAGVAAILHVAIITFSMLADWFRERAAQIKNDSTKLGITVADDIKNDNVSFIQGIFDTDTQKFIEVRRIVGKEAEQRVREAHKVHSVAVWN